MQVTPEMRMRAVAVLHRLCPSVGGRWHSDGDRARDIEAMADQVLDHALRPERRKSVELSKHVFHLEKARAAEVERHEKLERVLRDRVAELEGALAQLGKQRRVQRVLRALASAVRRA